MKNYLDQLATELYLRVVDNNQPKYVGLCDHLMFDSNATVSVDGIEILPKYHYLAVGGVLTINEPFYCWYHRVSGQGWLLIPH